MWILVAAGSLFTTGLTTIAVNLFAGSGSLQLSFVGLLPMVAAAVLVLGTASL